MFPLLLIGAVGLLIGGGIGYIIGHKTKDEQLADCVDALTEKGISEEQAVRICLKAMEENTKTDFFKTAGIIAVGYVAYRMLKGGNKDANSR